MKKYLFLIGLFWSTLAFAGQRATLQDGNNKELGTSSNPVYVTSPSGILSLADPNADRIYFWDDSAGSAAFLTVGTGLDITGTTLTSTAGGGWTDGGTDVTLTTTTDNPVVGTGASIGKLTVTGDADEIQLNVKGHATQNSSVIVAEKSDGTDLLTLSNTGVLTVSGSGSAGITTTGNLTISGTGAQSTITEGLIVNNGSGTDEDDDFTMNVTGGTYEFDAGDGTFRSTANDAGWTVVDQTDNQACTTGCTSACVMGWDGTTPVSCNSALADVCLCMGAS